VAAVKEISPETQVIAVPTNVTEPESVAELFGKTKETFGRLDLLFNNAGFGGKGVLLEDLEFKNWRAVIDTNLTGAFLCTQQAIQDHEGPGTARRAHHQ